MAKTQYKAIRTRFHGPSNNYGSRFSATDGDGNKVVKSRDFALTADGNHERVAQALADKMGWKGELRGGEFNGDHYFVFVT